MDLISTAAAYILLGFLSHNEAVGLTESRIDFFFLL